MHTYIHTWIHTYIHTTGFLARLERTYAACTTKCRIDANTWTHVAASIDGNGTANFYLNGTLRSVTFVDGGMHAPPFRVSNWGMSVGRSHPGAYPTGYFTGSIGDVRVWGTNRRESDINTTMGMACGGPQASAALVTCLLHEAAGIGDKSGHAVVTQPFDMVRFGASVILGDQHLPWCVTMNDKGKIEDPICFK